MTRFFDHIRAIVKLVWLALEDRVNKCYILNSIIYSNNFLSI